MSENTRRNPFPGPQPYRAEEHAYFFGREDVVRRLCNRILAYPCTMLFGPSGSGKTSLMQAGVIPLLSREHGVRTVCIDAWLSSHEGSQKEGTALRPLQQLIEKLYSTFELGTVPTGARPEEAVALLEEAVRRARPRSDRPVLISLDQLEQLFYRGHQQETTGELLVSLEMLANLPLRGLQLVLTIREDYLGIFRDQARGLPLLLDQGFRLGPLTVRQMVQVACKLAKVGEAPQNDWSEEMARELMLQVCMAGQAKTDDAELQAAYAQIVCRALWEERASGGRAGILKAEPILHRYLETTLNSLGPLREDARKLLENYLVADDGSRTLLTEQEALEALRKANASQVLQRLEQAAILLSDEHRGLRYYELGHDWLATKVHERKLRRLRDNRLKRTILVGMSACVVLTVIILSLWKIEQQRHDLDLSLMGQAQELLGRDQAVLATKLLLEVGVREQTTQWDTLAKEALTSNFLEMTFQGSGESLRTATFSPDSQHLLIASREGTVEVWRFEPSRHRLFELPRQEGVITSAQFSPGGERILTATRDGAVKVWRADGSKELLFELPRQEGGLTSAEFSPLGESIVTSTRDGRVRVWRDEARTEPLFELPRHDKPVTSARFSPEGQRILTTTQDGQLRVWRAQQWTGLPRLLFELPGHADTGKEAMTEAITSAEFSPDGERIVTGYQNGTARVWRADDANQPPLELKGHKITLSSVRFSLDRKRILTASQDGTVKVWRADGLGQPLFVLKGHAEAISSAEFSLNSRHLVTTSWDGTAKVWRATGEGYPLFSLEAHQGAITSVDFSPEGQRLLTTSRDETIKVWPSEGSAQPLLMMEQTEGSFTAADFSPDGRRLATSTWNGTVKVWPGAGAKQPLFELKETGTAFSTIKFSPDLEGQYLVSGAWDGTVRVWRADGTQEPLFTLKAHQAPVTAATFSPDSQHLVTAARDGTVKVWRTDGTQEPLFVLEAHEAPVTVATFSPDGERLLTASRDGTAKVWRADGGNKPLFTLSKLEAPLLAATFSPKGDSIATASASGTLNLWEMDGAPSPLFVLKAHEEPITAMAFSPDGQQLLTADWDGILRLWVLPSLSSSTRPKLRQRLEWSNTDCLAPYQRQSYLHESLQRAKKHHEQCKQAYQHGPAQDTPHRARRP